MSKSSPKKKHIEKKGKSVPEEDNLGKSSFLGSQTYDNISELEVTENDGLQAELKRVKDRKRKYNIKNAKVLLPPDALGVDSSASKLYNKDETGDDLEIPSLEEHPDLSKLKKRRGQKRKDENIHAISIDDKDTFSHSQANSTVTNLSYSAFVSDEFDDTGVVLKKVQQKRRKLNKMSQKRGNETTTFTDDYNSSIDDVSLDTTVNLVKNRLANQKKRSTYPGRRTRVDISNVFVPEDKELDKKI